MVKHSVLKFFSFLFFLFFIFLSAPKPAHAAVGCPELKVLDGDGPGGSYDPNYKGLITLQSSGDCFANDLPYWVVIYPKGAKLIDVFSAESSYLSQQTDKTPVFHNEQTTKDKTFITGSFDLGRARDALNDKFNNGGLSFTITDTWIMGVCNKDIDWASCDPSIITGKGAHGLGTAEFKVPLPPAVVPPGGEQPPADLPLIDPLGNDTCTVQYGAPLLLIVSNLTPGKTYDWFYNDSWVKPTQGRIQAKDPIGSFTIDKSKQTPGSHHVCVDVQYARRVGPNCLLVTFSNVPPDPTKTGCTLANSGDQAEPPPPVVSPPCDAANQTKDATSGAIIGCAKITTGVGDISTDPFEFIKSVFGIFLGISGGVALLLIMLSGYRLMMSQGNPEKIQEARETLTAAIVGLLIILLSMVILQVIGVDILHIPGLS